MSVPLYQETIVKKWSDGLAGSAETMAEVTDASDPGLHCGLHAYGA